MLSSHVFDLKDLCNPDDDQQQSRNELAEYVNLKSAQDWDIYLTVLERQQVTLLKTISSCK